MKFCAVSPPQYEHFFQCCAVHLNCCPINKVCAVFPPSQHTFLCAVSPPNRYLTQVELSIKLNLCLQVWHSQLSLFLFLTGRIFFVGTTQTNNILLPGAHLTKKKTYCFPDPFQPFKAYLPEPNQQLTTYLPEPIQKCWSNMWKNVCFGVSTFLELSFLLCFLLF